MASSNVGRYRLLLSNTAVFAVGNLTVKLISFVLMPLYTLYLSESEYGVGELLNNSIEILLPIATLGIIEAVYRFAIDDSSDRKSIFVMAVLLVLGGDVLVGMGCYVCSSLLGSDNMFELWALFVAASFYRVTTQFARGLGQAKRFALYGVINSIILVAANYVLIVWAKAGVSGYLYSFSIGFGLTSFVAFFASREYRFLIPLRLSRGVCVEMLRYSLPLVPNLISWWVTSMSSRYVVLIISGPAAAGVYAAASKLPSMVNVFTSIFQQAWQYSTAKEIDSEESGSFFTNVFRAYSLFCASVVCILLMLNRPICDLLLQSGFNEAWRIVPLLLLAAAYGCLSSFFGTFYQALKSNKNLMISTVVGAAVCAVTAPPLVLWQGMAGAAYSMAVSYFVILAMRFWDIRKRIRISVSLGRLMLQFVPLSCFALLCCYWSGTITTLVGLICLLMILLSDRGIMRNAKSGLLRLMR